jgi:hypothetical protein
LPLVDYFMPNGDQLLAITGAADIDGGIKTVLGAGAGAVAVTMGATAAGSSPAAPTLHPGRVRAGGAAHAPVPALRS